MRRSVPALLLATVLPLAAGAGNDERTATVVALCAIDNLCKGASGGALQCANLALGLDETMGLPRVGVSP